MDVTWEMLRKHVEAPPPVASLADLAQAAGLATLYFGGTSDIWWRGHADCDWHLVPFVHRRAEEGYENNITGRFMRRARTRRPSCPDDTDAAGWRFFDAALWAADSTAGLDCIPLIAAYFAAKEHPEKDGCIWAMLPVAMNEKLSKERTIIGAHRNHAHTLLTGGQTGHKSDLAIAIITNENDIRMLVQLSHFTVHGSPTPLETQVDRTCLIKFLIPAKAKTRLAAQLTMLGMRMSNLFPDLEHLAHELRDMSFQPRRIADAGIVLSDAEEKERGDPVRLKEPPPS
jgi:hypothetical protein